MKKKKEKPGLSYTQQVKKNRREREFWDRFFQTPENLDDIPGHMHWVKFSFSSITDEELGFFTDRVRSVNMLDLKDTRIGMDGIRHLLKMDFIGELRLKESLAIDDVCMPFISQLTSLKLLQLNGTGVTTAGLKYLESLVNLEQVFLSLDMNDDENRQAVNGCRPFTYTIKTRCLFIIMQVKAPAII